MQTDPTLDPSIFDKLYHSGAWVPFGILVAFFGLRAASTRIAWLKEDHRAAWVSAVLGGLALLVVPATQGTTPNLSMILGAIVTVTAIHADPKKTVAEQKQAQAGFIRLGLMVVIAVIASSVLLFGCSGSTRLKTLGGAQATLSALEISLQSYDTAHLADIAQHGTSRADIDAKTAAWVAQYQKAHDMLVAGLKLVVAGYTVDDDASAATASAAATAALAFLVSLGVKP